MLAKEKKINKYLITIKEINEIEIYQKEGISFFVFPLKNYCVGYEFCFSEIEINNITGVNKVVLINRVLENDDIDNLKRILPKIEAEYFIIEDIGLIEILNNLNKKIILNINHFNCNSQSINVWNEFVYSCFISNELTKEEVFEITNKSNKEVCIQIFGYNQVMYSRRKLLENYYEYYKLNKKTKAKIKDQSKLVNFTLVESDLGTIALSEHIMCLNELLNTENVLFYYLNTSYIKIDDVLKFIHGSKIDNSDNSFLEKETIFKLGVKE